MSNILSIGQCGFDHSTLSRFFREQWDARIVDAEDEDEAWDELSNGEFALVLVNRLFDTNGADGVDLIRRWHKEGVAPPLMLVSNFAEAQERSVVAGGVPGFGKGSLGSPAMVAQLDPFLK